MSKRLAEKAALIKLPELGTPADSVPHAKPATQALAPTTQSRTAPGAMAHFMASQSDALVEVKQLRERLQAFDGATPARQLDPRTVRPSRWANRHSASFEGQAFAELRDEIASAGGNVQPIKVRPLVPREGDFEYEVVFGLRRHRACLELSLPVMAIVEAVDDRRLFEEMERENRSRANLSAWEQGMMYRRALDEGLYPSQRKLSEALGVDVALVSKSLTLARLPDVVVGAFSSPLEIQYRWAQPLADAVQKDPDSVLARAREITSLPSKPAAKEVLELLLNPPAASAAAEPLVLGEGTRTVRWKPGSKGAVRIDVAPGTLTARQLEALQEWLRKALAK